MLLRLNATDYEIEIKMPRTLLAIFVSCTATLAGAEETRPELVDYVVELLRHSDAEFRAVALEEISYSAPGRTATQTFAATLPTLSNDAQVALLRALAVRGDRAAKQAVLKELADSDNESVRVAARSRSQVARFTCCISS